MNNILPIFYTHGSRKSLFTFWTGRDVTPEGPSSVIDIALKNGLKEVYCVSNSFYEFIEGWKACKENKISFCTL